MNLVPLAAFLPFFSTMAGGIATLRLSHRIHPLMALASGVLVATAAADLLPEAHELAGPAAAVEIGAALVAGYVVFLLIEAYIHQGTFEHGQLSGELGHLPGETPLARGAGSIRPTRGLLAVLPPASLILHSTLDGLAIGFGFQAGGNVGLLVLLAVLAHDFADGMNVVTLAFEAARGERLPIGLLVLDALAPPVGAGLSVLVSIPPATLGLLLAWFAGVFLAIGAGHLLPEAQHQQPAGAPVFVVLAAAGAAIVLVVRSVAL